MPRPLEEAVVAITGGSSGIGRAAALRFARRGSALALCGRDPEALRRVGSECEAGGAEMLTRPLDVWVNNAGAIAYGEFLEIPSDVFRQVIETNLMGQVHGARAALRRFRAQGGGVLINVSSVWGQVSSPQVTPYIASKNAVRAFSECLRGELAGERGIHVTTLAPEGVEGGWRRARRPTMRRAFAGAVLGQPRGERGGEPPR